LLLKAKHFFEQYHIVKIVFLLLSLGFLAYHQTLSFPFVHDDVVFIRNNPHISDLSRVLSIFGRPSELGDGIVNANLYYRPLLDIVHRLQYRVFQFNPGGYHFFNILVHVVNSLLVFLLLKILIKRRGFSLGVSLLFLLHPIQTEAVTSVVGISNLLFTMFCLSSLYFYLFSEQVQNKRTKILFNAVSFLSFVFALFSKEHAVILPFLVLLIVKYFPGTLSGSKKSYWKACLPFFLIAIAYFIFRARIGISPHGSIFNHLGELLLRINTIPKTVLMYWGLLLFPRNLHYYRSIDVLEPTVLPAIIFIVLLLGIVFLSSFLKKDKKTLFEFGLLWFVIALLPALNIFPLIIEYSIISTAEHFLYMPIIGFLLCAFVVGEHVLRLINIRQKHVIALITGLCLIFLSLTIRQNQYWDGEIALFERTTYFEKKIGRVYSLMGKAYYFGGHVDKSVASYQKALNILNGYLQKIKDQRAIKFYSALIKEVYFDLAHCYVSKGNFSKALEQYSMASIIDPNDLQIQNNMGSIYLQQGRAREAAPYFRKTILKDPKNVMAINNLAICHIQEGKFDEAESLLREALKINGNFLSARQNLEKLILQKKNSQP